MKTSVPDLLDRGYRRFDESDHTFYQKRFWTASGDETRYFINVKEYDLGRFIPNGRIMFSVSIQIQTPAPDDVTYDISFSGDNLTIEDAEARVEQLFVTLAARNYGS